MPVKKSEALQLFGGTVSTAAAALQITPSAVSQWPDDEDGDLPDPVVRRIEAELFRRLPAKLQQQAKGGGPHDR